MPGRALAGQCCVVGPTPEASESPRERSPVKGLLRSRSRHVPTHPGDEVLPLGKLAFYSAQHVLAFYARAVIVPILLAEPPERGSKGVRFQRSRVGALTTRVLAQSKAPNVKRRSGALVSGLALILTVGVSPRRRW